VETGLLTTEQKNFLFLKKVIDFYFISPFKYHLPRIAAKHIYLDQTEHQYYIFAVCGIFNFSKTVSFSFGTCNFGSTGLRHKLRLKAAISKNQKELSFSSNYSLKQ
jgi:hypothetical protein